MTFKKNKGKHLTMRNHKSPTYLLTLGLTLTMALTGSTTILKAQIAKENEIPITIEDGDKKNSLNGIKDFSEDLPALPKKVQSNDASSQTSTPKKKKESSFADDGGMNIISSSKPAQTETVKQEQPKEEATQTTTSIKQNAENSQTAAPVSVSVKKPDVAPTKTTINVPSPGSLPVEPPVEAVKPTVTKKTDNTETATTTPAPANKKAENSISTGIVSKNDINFDDEEDIQRLMNKLQKESSKKTTLRGNVIPNQIQDEINFDRVPLGKAFRLLAEQAGINYVEPTLERDELVSLRFQNMTPLEAFMRLARAKGFQVIVENGITTLQGGAIVKNQIMLVRKYKLLHTQAKWVAQSVANLLEINIKAPADTIATYPAPNKAAASYGGSGSSSGGSSGGNSGSSGSGSQNIGLPTSPRWTSSLPFDEPLYTGGDLKSPEKPFIFIDRAENALVIKATEEKQQIVSEYLKSVDKEEPQIMIETKVIDVTLTDALVYGTDWSKALGTGLSATAKFGGATASTLFTTSGWNLVLTTSEVTATIQAFEQLGKGAVVNMPKTMTRSGVPVSISSTVTQSLQSYQYSTSTGSSGTVSSPSGYNTFTTGMTIDVVAQILDNGLVDININPTVADQVGTTTTGGASTNNATGAGPAQSNTNSQAVPIIATRSITTSATVPSGMTIMLGGLCTTKKVHNTTGIPILCKIPLVGKTLFGNENIADERDTLIIFVTPVIVWPNQYQKVYTDKETWNAMRDGNEGNTVNDMQHMPNQQSIENADAVKRTLIPANSISPTNYQPFNSKQKPKKKGKDKNNQVGQQVTQAQ
jgi:type II secretory pathway component GspD/PulD (secretin)